MIDGLREKFSIAIIGVIWLNCVMLVCGRSLLRMRPQT
jgi:hypothetical protein